MDKYGLVGDNIAFSLSPLVYDYWFDQYNIKAKYDLIEIDNLQFDHSFLKNLLFIKNYKGLNFTNPFKEKVLLLIDYLNKTSTISDEVSIINSTNCVINSNEQIYVYNTDYLGLSDSFDYHSINMKDKDILVIGAGGSAKSLIYSCLNQVNNIFIINRSRDKLEKIIKKFNNPKIKELKSNDNLSNIDIIFNATSVNFNYIYNSFFGDLILKDHMIYYDLNYYSDKLFFLKNNFDNKKMYNGLMMLIFQAMHNFELWFGFKPLLDDRLLELLKRTK